MGDPIKVLVVDDSRLFRTAVAESLAGETDVQVIGSMPAARDAVKVGVTISANTVKDAEGVARGTRIAIVEK